MQRRVARRAGAGLLAAACVACVSPRGTPIDQVPRYGDLDRAAIPVLRRADETFIQGVSAEFGSRAQASRLFADRGFELYRQDDLVTAMKRFNQAWLLDPQNADAHWGFGSVLHDRRDNCGALEHMETAYRLHPSHPSFYADYGLVAALCSARPMGDGVDPEALVRRSEELFAEAIRAQPDSGYVYAMWAMALGAEGKIAGAWAKVLRAESLGGTVPPAVLQELAKRMPRPAPAP